MARESFSFMNLEFTNGIFAEMVARARTKLVASDGTAAGIAEIDVVATRAATGTLATADTICVLQRFLLDPSA